MSLATFRIAESILYGIVTAGRDVAVELWWNDHCDLHVGGTEAADSSDAVRQEVGLREVPADGEAAVPSQSTVWANTRPVSSRATCA